MECAGRDWGRVIQSRVPGLPSSTWSTSHPYPHPHLYLLLVSPYFIAQLWHSHAQLECALFPVPAASSCSCCSSSSCSCCCFVISFDIACHSSFCFHCNFLPCCTQLTAIAATAAVPLVPLTPPTSPRPGTVCLLCCTPLVCLLSRVCVGVSHCVICAPRAC